MKVIKNLPAGSQLDPEVKFRQSFHLSYSQDTSGRTTKATIDSMNQTQNIFRIQETQPTKTIYGLPRPFYKQGLLLKPGHNRYALHKHKGAGELVRQQSEIQEQPKVLLAHMGSKQFRTSQESSRDTEAPASSKSLPPVERSLLTRKASLMPAVAEIPAVPLKPILGLLSSRPLPPVRKYSLQHHLVNFMHGVHVSSKAKGPDGMLLSSCRTLVGAGNNAALVEYFLKSKPGVVSELFFSKSNIQWTQTQLKQLVATPIYKVTTSGLKMVESFCENESIEITDPIKMVQMIEGLKLFRCSSPNLVKELVLANTRSGTIHNLCSETLNIVNHLKGSVMIAHKTKLAKTIVKYCKSKYLDPFSIIPTTFLIRGNCMDIDLQNLMCTKQRDDPQFQEPLIIKPGENSNRGIGISVAYSEIELKSQVECILQNRKSTSTVVVQYYISSPLLFQQRKFDIRCYGLMVRNCPRSISFYWYLDGYARTSSYVYEVNNKTNLLVHLTNEAVQVKDKACFGSQEPGNKVYFGKLDEYFRSDPTFIEKGKQWNRDIVPLFKVTPG